MDLLDNIQYQNFNLYIEIGEIDYGWMDITLVSHYAYKKYCASYLCDPINDLVQKFALLIDNKPFQINPFESRMNIAIVEHDCEEGNIVWLLRKSNDDLYIYIWENEYELDEWLLADFSTGYFLDNDELLPNITKNLIFSLRGTMKDFAGTVIKTVEYLKNQARQLDPKDDWGYKISDSDYHEVLKLVRP